MWELDCEESWVPKNWCFWSVVLEKTLESPLDCKEIQPFHPKGDQSWGSIGRTDVEAETLFSTLATWFKELAHLKRPWCWERLRAGGEGDDRRWNGWMVPLTQWTWVWIDSGSWWWTGRPSVLQSMESQRVRHDLANRVSEWELGRWEWGEVKWRTSSGSGVSFWGDENVLKYSTWWLHNSGSILQATRIYTLNWYIIW